MAQFVLRHNRAGHDHPYEDDNRWAFEFDLKEFDLLTACCRLAGQAWSNPDISNKVDRYWRMRDAKVVEGGVICELYWIGMGSRVSPSHWIKIEGPVCPEGPW